MRKRLAFDDVQEDNAKVDFVIGNARVLGETVMLTTMTMMTVMKEIMTKMVRAMMMMQGKW